MVAAGSDDGGDGNYDAQSTDRRQDGFALVPGRSPCGASLAVSGTCTHRHGFQRSIALRILRGPQQVPPASDLVIHI
jgi:hypothetical protein